MQQRGEIYPLTHAQFNALVKLIDAASANAVVQKCNHDPNVLARFGNRYEELKQIAKRMLVGDE